LQQENKDYTQIGADIMRKPCVALLTIAETRDEFYEKRKPIVDEEIAFFHQQFSECFDILASVPIRGVSTALYWAEQAQSALADAVIIHVPIWAAPNLAGKIAANVDLPLMVLGNKRENSSSLVGVLAVAGAIGQTGKQVKRILGDFSDSSVQAGVVAFASACQTVRELKRSNYCVLGGRSLGINTTLADFAQWQKMFGIECDHRDQYEIVRRAETIDPARTSLHIDWLRSHTGLMAYGGAFSPQSLIKQVNSYLALKDIIAEGNYDFIGLKCQSELSDHYAIGCLAMALLGDTQDAEGAKQSVPVACEADNDGALTMRILSLIAGRPSNLMDIRLLRAEDQEIVFANCGGMPTYFAGRSPNAAENLVQVHMMENAFGKAGGGTVQFVCAPGEVTVARLFRVDGRYCLGAMEGSFIDRPREDLRRTTYCWPHAFFRSDIDFTKFFNTIGANHMHAVYGCHAQALRDLCALLDIEYINYNR
jgi:L-fucose isomerase